MESNFMTIAQCAATFLAILGGLIATKLISLQAERNECIEKLKDNKNLLEKFQNEIASKEDILLKNDAKEFIVLNLDSLYSNKTDIEQMFSSYDGNYNIEQMQIYWEKGLEVLKQISLCDGERDQDGIPISCKDKFDAFEREIAAIIIEDIRNRSNAFSINMNNMLSITETLKLDDLERDVDKLYAECEYINKQIDAFESHISALTLPKNLSGGLILLGINALTTIIFPMVVVGIYDNISDCLIHILYWASLSLFAICLISVVLYFRLMLKNK